MVDGPFSVGHVHFDRGNLKLYVRKLSLRTFPVLLDIGSADAKREKTGSLKRFLDEYEHIGLYIENVANEHLESHLERRPGYVRKDSGYMTPEGYRNVGPPSFWIATDRDAATPAAQRIIDVLLPRVRRPRTDILDSAEN